MIFISLISPKETQNEIEYFEGHFKIKLYLWQVPSLKHDDYDDNCKNPTDNHKQFVSLGNNTVLIIKPKFHRWDTDKYEDSWL